MLFRTAPPAAGLLRPAVTCYVMLRPPPPRLVQSPPRLVHDRPPAVVLPLPAAELPPPQSLAAPRLTFGQDGLRAPGALLVAHCGARRSGLEERHPTGHDHQQQVLGGRVGGRNMASHRAGNLTSASGPATPPARKP